MNSIFFATPYACEVLWMLILILFWSPSRECDWNSDLFDDVLGTMDVVGLTGVNSIGFDFKRWLESFFFFFFS